MFPVSKHYSLFTYTWYTFNFVKGAQKLTKKEGENEGDFYRKVTTLHVREKQRDAAVVSNDALIC